MLDDRLILFVYIAGIHGVYVRVYIDFNLYTEGQVRQSVAFYRVLTFLMAHCYILISKTNNGMVARLLIANLQVCIFDNIREVNLHI